MDIDIEQYLKKFRIDYPQILFPPDFNLLKENRCILCMNKLHFPRFKKIAYCDSKKHKRFIISLSKLKELSR